VNDFRQRHVRYVERPIPCLADCRDEGILVRKPLITGLVGSDERAPECLTLVGQQNRFPVIVGRHPEPSPIVLEDGLSAGFVNGPKVDATAGHGPQPSAWMRIL
jgi:hypothetical protein